MINNHLNITLDNCTKDVPPLVWEHVFKDSGRFFTKMSCLHLTRDIVALNTQGFYSSLATS
jgi:hypothetical protein